ncbi:hypothetical protein [Serratia odorifera]|uniref:hypothetical protein n=1 Tax=Serratia odorifera TaxID=618 RepID=UPI0030B906BA
MRIRGQQQFGELAERVHPRRTFDDLIVSPELTTALREILAAIRQRERVLERGFARKVGYGTGISTLFYGRRAPARPWRPRSWPVSWDWI